MECTSINVKSRFKVVSPTVSSIFPSLHFTIHHSCILTVTINMVDFSNEAMLGECWVQYMVQVYGQQRDHTRISRRVYGVASVVSVCPRIGAMSHASVGQQI